MKKFHTPTQGFTLLEILVSLSIGISLLGVLLSIYVVTISSYTNNQDRSELTQDSRIIMERITRDIRESQAFATILPENAEDPQHPPPNDIELRDGHSQTLQYIRYYTTGTDISRQIRHYSFPAEPSILVPFDAEDQLGNPPNLSIISDIKVGEYVQDIDFYGTNPIYLNLELKKREITHNTRTVIYARNL